MSISVVHTTSGLFWIPSQFLASKSGQRVHTKTSHTLGWPKRAVLAYQRVHIYFNTWQLNTLRRNEDSHLVLRNNNEMAYPFARTSLIEGLPYTRIPKTWLEFLRNKKTYQDLKDHFVSLLKRLVICDRLLCLQCHPPDRL